MEGENTYSFVGTTGLNQVITSQRNNILLQSGGFLTYTLPANRNYSNYYITVGAENITSDDKFSEPYMNETRLLAGRKGYCMPATPYMYIHA